MQIHLSDITDSEGKIIQFSSEVELDKISFQMGEFPILDRSPVELRIANTGNKVLELTGKGSHKNRRHNQLCDSACQTRLPA